MTTCPRCGRVADESVCGTSLALARRAADLEAVSARALGSRTGAHFTLTTLGSFIYTMLDAPRAKRARPGSR